MKIIYICIGGPLTGKTILASLLKGNSFVIDNYVPSLMNDVELATSINKLKDNNAIFFIVCQEYPASLILALEQYLEGKYKTIICENRVVLDNSFLEGFE